MVTNASLLTKELAHEAKEQWNLKRVQVSLDGAREDYTPRKNYYNPEKHNYDVVMKAIHYLADEGIKVNLRCNFDWENIESMNYCMAGSMDKSIVITPNGMFNNCEHLPENNTWGNIFDGVTDEDRFRELSAAVKVDEKCAKCPFLPQCTPFYKYGCPGWFEKCYEYHCMRTEYAMHNLLKGVNTEAEDDDEEI